MARLILGNIHEELKFNKIEGELAVADRQLAWELYSQIVTRVAIRGKIDARGYDTFRGEVLSEGFDEVDEFSREARGIMIRYPVGHLEGNQNHLGFFIARSLELVVRHFLEKWQSEYRSWWEINKINGAPFVVQRNYPQIDAMLGHWSTLRRFYRDTLTELSTIYGFVDVVGELTPEFQAAWYE